MSLGTLAPVYEAFANDVEEDLVRKRGSDVREARHSCKWHFF